MMAPSKWPCVSGSAFLWISGYLEQRSPTGNLGASRDPQHPQEEGDVPCEHPAPSCHKGDMDKGAEGSKPREQKTEEAQYAQAQSCPNQVQGLCHHTLLRLEGAEQENPRHLSDAPSLLQD